MNYLKNGVLLCVFIIYCYSCNFADREPEKQNNISSNSTGKQFSVIKKAFLEQNKGISLIEKDNFSKLFWGFYDSNIHPNECYTDINNDQMIDYAFLIKENNKLKIVIAYSAEKKYSYWVSPIALEEITPEGIHFCIIEKPAGRTDVIRKKPESLILKKNGFAIMNLEQESKILYELNGRVQLFESQ